jgi:D-aspartate ligase
MAKPFVDPSKWLVRQSFEGHSAMSAANSIAKLRVLLVDGHTRQSLPVARALRKKGVHVTVLCSNLFDMGYVSRWPHKRLLGTDAKIDPSGFITSVQEQLQTKHYDVLVPLFDYAAEEVSKHKPVLSQWTRVAIPDYPIFLQARDKLETMRICMEHYIPCPRTLLEVNSVAAVRSADLTFPIVVKPRRGDSAVGFTCVNTEEELDQALKRLTAKFGPVLVQEYIPQTDLQYKAELFLDDAGALKGAVVFSKIRWHPIDGGSSTLNVTVKRPDIIENCTKLLRAMRWVGYADIDLIQDPRDQHAKVMEINPRVTGSVKIAFDAGVDFAEMIVQEAMGYPVNDYLNYTIGRYLRYFHKDVLWFLESPDRFCSKPSWFDFQQTTDQIFSIEDPLPGLTYSFRAFWKWVRRK